MNGLIIEAAIDEMLSHDDHEISFDGAINISHHILDMLAVVHLNRATLMKQSRGAHGDVIRGTISDELSDYLTELILLSGKA